MKKLIAISIGTLLFIQSGFSWALTSESGASDVDQVVHGDATAEADGPENAVSKNVAAAGVESTVKNQSGLSSELYQLKAEKKLANAEPSNSGSQMLMGLLAVLGVIVLLAWAVKRMNLQGMNVGNDLKLQSILSLGTKEKVAVIEVEGKRLLLGITPQNINMLCELDENQDLDTGGESKNTQQVSFAQQIKKALKQGNMGEKSSASQ